MFARSVVVVRAVVGAHRVILDAASNTRVATFARAGAIIDVAFSMARAIFGALARGAVIAGEAHFAFAPRRGTCTVSRTFIRAPHRLRKDDLRAIAAVEPAVA